MTIYRNDPIRVKITMDDVLKLTHKKGVDSCAYQSLDQKDEFFIQFVCSDIDPYNQKEEKYKDDIDREIEKLKVIQDHIREFYPNRLFNSQDSGMSKECVLDPKIFGKENKYDILLDKATDIHRLKNGQLFGTIER